MIICKDVKSYVSALYQQKPHYEENESRLPIPFQSFQSLKECISECFPVGRAECIQQGVDCLMVRGLQMVLHLVKSIAHHLREKSSNGWSSAPIPTHKARARGPNGSFCTDTGSLFLSRRHAFQNSCYNLNRSFITRARPLPETCFSRGSLRFASLTSAPFPSVENLKSKAKIK